MSKKITYPVFEFYYPKRGVVQRKLLIPEDIYEAYKNMPFETKEQQKAAKEFFKSHTGSMEWFIAGSPYYLAMETGFVEVNGGNYPVTVTMLSDIGNYNDEFIDED